MGKKGLVANAISNNSKLIIAMANNNNKITSYNYNSDFNLINSLSISPLLVTCIGKTTNNNNSYSNCISNFANSVGKPVGVGVGVGVVSKGRNWYLIEDLQKLFISYFKSIFCLISKAKFYQKADKLIIEIFYYITIPDANIFSWFNILKNPLLSLKLNNVTQQSQLGTLPMQGLPMQVANTKINKLKKNKVIEILRKMEDSQNSDIFFKLNITNINSLFLVKFKSLVRWLNSIFIQPIELKLIRLHHSDSESHILAQLFFLVIKKKNIRSVINKIYNKNKIKDINLAYASNPFVETNNNKFIPVFISGLYIHIGGRLMREPIIPRITTKKFEKGAISQGKVNSLEKTQITRKNKKGAFTIKITFAQNIY